MKRIIVVVGTRPEIIKLAPVILKARQRYPDRIRLDVCSTGQHRTLGQEAFSLFQLSPDVDLGIMKENQSINDICAAVFQRLPGVLRTAQPDLLMVQGDTTTAGMAALCAFNMKIPVAHVEAGLRSNNVEAPYPEETNRKMITSVASYHFCPTQSARENLIKESIPEKAIHVTGNTVVDALAHIQSRHSLDGLAEVESGVRQPFVLVTAHRRESFGKGFENICNALRESALQFPDHQFVYPVHLNPNVKNPVHALLGGVKNVLLIPPVSYLKLLTLLKYCAFVITDSGGIQEEAPTFAKYCIVLREVTERTESIRQGIAELVGTDVGNTCAAVERCIKNPRSGFPLGNPYGDGRASERILEVLLKAA